ncbi:TPA: metallophosphoesterase [Kluyvera intermedia]|uniref:Calcineurin-like phosphoesterase domain-containing protein n=2 Tax=Enterobacteriaceae TaxID=543 RepID=A0AAC8QTM5_9ENTR|nr:MULTISPECIES: metallophosphoesterase [Enterobacteriaceae]HAT2206436.1 metallophosphoesterase [Kluyvera intermedia]AKL14683.1 hypothetical protein AB182_26920 [Phytobacter ursingii]MCL9673247.1 metallophosphoesterase [Citrobacter sp. MNAZ 1397]HAT2517110.1 metallophosphoesterase [Kluyvera intermedia]HAT2604935.1 metallophosphoesterase [Kluyvera intermedia]
MFFIWMLLPALYIGSRFIWWLPLPPVLRLGLFLVLVGICEFRFFSRWLWGGSFSPEWPRLVVMLAGGLFGAVVLFASFLLLRDVLALLVGLLTGKTLPALPIMLPLLVLSVVLAVIGVWQATRIPHVRTVHVEIPGLPPAFDGYRLVQLADIHATRLLPRKWVQQIVAKTNALQPDLIALTGDMSDGAVEDRLPDVEPLTQLRAADGVYAITGNHEYYFDYASWAPAWQKLSIPFLTNQHVRIARGDDSFVLAGVPDIAARNYGFAGPDLKRALEGTRPNDTVILLDHRPGTADDNAAAGVKLQLSGHTHGGMVLGLDQLVKPLNNGYISGRYSVGPMTLYVSNGAGLWNGFPLRLGRPSEITELILHPTTSAAR